MHRQEAIVKLAAEIVASVEELDITVWGVDRCASALRSLIEYDRWVAEED
jgi:hypothetical protein